ncbi:hypothetical protein [Horseradish latent virus]|uniref:Uncharacterized protein n=1 Tax=Horseradish latent virus TaxID=264076 RepID=K0DHH6_9VIRU|nr:hypothetical protein [Horseradish latent virus]AFT84155.1 hypothetical protein [Horseradish latent virus]
MKDNEKTGSSDGHCSGQIYLNLLILSLRRLTLISGSKGLLINPYQFKILLIKKLNKWFKCHKSTFRSTNLVVQKLVSEP